MVVFSVSKSPCDGAFLLDSFKLNAGEPAGKAAFAVEEHFNGRDASILVKSGSRNSPHLQKEPCKSRVFQMPSFRYFVNQL